MNGQTNTNEQKKKKNRKKERMNEGKGKSEEWRRNEGKKEKERKKRKLIFHLPNKSYNSSLLRHRAPPPNPSPFWTLQLSNSHDL